jgi:hypothetical protein
MTSEAPSTSRFPAGFAAAAMVVALAIAGSAMPLCGAMFGCGCSALGTGHCNIHTPGVPHCPWCAVHKGIGAGVFMGMLLAGIAGAYGGVGLVRRGRVFAGVGLGLFAYLVLASLTGLILAITMKYPLWWGIRVFR